MRCFHAVFLSWLLALPLSARADADRVHQLVVERLGWMEAVAQWKWANDIAVEDLEREVLVLDGAATKAVELGLPEAPMRGFFSAQIAAAKAIQFCWIDKYRTGSVMPAADPPDLMDDIRPALLDLGAQITTTIANSIGDPDLGDTESVFAAAQDLECLDAWHLTKLAESLAQNSDR